MDRCSGRYVVARLVGWSDQAVTLIKCHKSLGSVLMGVLYYSLIKGRWVQGKVGGDIQ